MKSRRARACDISPKVKQKVFERDGRACILCGRSGAPNAHYIPRSAGGLGIEQNVVTLCWACHFALDHTIDRNRLLAIVKSYLDANYPDFTDERRVYRK
jgi:5-methylcytosine-specific restriction endonuclease McrA